MSDRTPEEREALARSLGYAGAGDAFVESTVVCAELRLREAIAKLESYANDGAMVSFGSALTDLLVAKGQLAQVVQLIRTVRDLGTAETERPSHLRVVK